MRNPLKGNRANQQIPYIIFFTLFVLYVVFGYGVTISNDSVTNIDQITALDLLHRSSHFGFHLLGIIFYLFFTKLMGFTAVTSVQVMLAFISATGAVSLYQITLLKYGNEKQAIVTVIIYSLASGIFRFSCQVEYIILVPSLGLISLYFYSKEKYLIAGVVFGLSFLTSFLSLLFTPMFFIFTKPKEILRKQNIIFALSTLIILIVINVFTSGDSMSGEWSYGQEIELYKSIFSDINFLRPLAILVYGYLRSFNIILFLLPFVLLSLYKINKQLFFILVITVLIHLPFAIPEARYGGYQMTAYPIISISVGYYIINILTDHKKSVVFIVSLYAFINIFLVYSERSFYRELRETYVRLNNNLEKNSVLIVYQAVKPIKKIYAPNLNVYNLLSDYQNKLAENIPGFIPTDLSGILNQNDTVYLLESGVSMPDDYIKLVFRQFTVNQGAKVKGFALDKVMTTDSSLVFKKLDGYSMDVYKLLKRKSK